MTRVDPFGIGGSVVDGRYRVEHVVGQGGFGVVYRAQHLGFESPIALKVLKLPDDGSSARRHARIASFQLEGRMLFELSGLHPSFVRALETGAIRGRDGSLAPYLALEWLDGVSLDREMKSRRSLGLPPFSLTDALALLSEPAEGLARAHARGIAHRDIKPGNLFISARDGEQSVKILDFGIAKLVDDSLDTSERFASSVTATASFTPLYAAPEQWLERLGATGTWTDVHALALVVVELLTGCAPFAGRERAQLRAACLDHVRPSPAARGVTLPPAVEAVLAQALALEPQRRFPDAGAFWAALCAAAPWRAQRAPLVVALTARDPSDDARLSLVPFVSEPAPPTGNTVTTAPLTAGRALPLRSGSLNLAKSAVAAVALVAASAVVVHDTSGRGRRARDQTLHAWTTTEITGDPALNPAPPALLAAVTSSSPAPKPPSVSVTVRPPLAVVPRTQDKPPAGNVLGASKPSPRPTSAPAPALAASPPTARVELAPETATTRPSVPVNLDDPALVRRK